MVAGQPSGRAEPRAPAPRVAPVPPAARGAESWLLRLEAGRACIYVADPGDSTFVLDDALFPTLRELQETEAWVGRISDYLQQAWQWHEFSALILVAPRTLLGALCRQLSGGLRSAVIETTEHPDPAPPPSGAVPGTRSRGRG